MKGLLIFTVFIILGSTSFQLIEQKRTPAKPNVLFILADDLGARDLSYTGSKYYETPHIDKIAKSGMIFNKAYASSSVCSPSRASIMTGKATPRHGITDWIGGPTGEEWGKKNRHIKLIPPKYKKFLPHSELTIAEALGLADFKTFFAGKWHLGGKNSLPQDHGFDINVGGYNSGRPNGGYYSPWKNPSLKNKTKGENLSMRLAQETVDFMSQNKEEGFFAFLSFYAVHGPIQTDKEKWSKYRTKAENMGIIDEGFDQEEILPIRKVQDNPIYAGLIENMDEAVGYVMNALEDLGLADNTIVIFTSDNGGVASGDNYSTSNLPFRGGKGYQFEGGIREPFFIKVPWLASGVSDYPVIGTDLYPTILDLVGEEQMPYQHRDGLSLKPILQGKELQDRPLYWHYPHYGNQGGQPNSIIQEDGWKLIYYWEDGRKELYNLNEDRSEQLNLAIKFPKITRDLNNKLIAWLADTQAEFPSKNPFYNKHQAKTRKNNLYALKGKCEKQRKAILDINFKPNQNWWGSQVTTRD